MKKDLIAVALSGGVDSAVAAALLKEQGATVIGLTMVLTDESRPVSVPSGEKLSAVDDARRVAAALGLEHHVIDLRAKFHQAVIAPFIAEYAAGRTPNPCVICNPALKFGALLAEAEKIGATKLATGHYARISADGYGRWHLCRAKDTAKDQSYVLYRLTPEILRRIYLPLGDFTKREIRALAEKYHLPVAQKPESQEICFIPNDDYHAFLRDNCPDCLHPGEIVHADGRIIGRHAGTPLYTIGQRKGLGIAWSEPLYVKEIDAAQNRLIVGEADSLWANHLIAADLSFTQPAPPRKSFRALAKIRYGHVGEMATVTLRSEKFSPINAENIPASLNADKKTTASVVFDAPVRAITPGQSVVFYADDEVIGGGIII